MRPSPAPIRPQGNGDFRDLESRLGCLNHHFGRKFHSQGSEVHRPPSLGSERTNATVEIPHPDPKKKPSNPTERRVADPPVLPWHRTRGDLPTAGRHPASHDQPGAGPHRADHPPHRGERITPVGVGHHNDPTHSGIHTAGYRGAIAPNLHWHHPRPRLLRRLPASIRASVVGYDNLAGQSGLMNGVPCLPYASPHRARLIQAREDDGNINPAARLSRALHPLRPRRIHQRPPSRRDLAAGSSAASGSTL